MKAKRLILMMLVMLMGVMGAWAQEPTKLHLTYVEHNGRGAIQAPENAFDGDFLRTFTNVDFRGFDSSKPYITFKTDFPVRVDQLSIHYVNTDPSLTEFELKGLKNEGGDWDTQSTSMLHETNLGMPTEYITSPGIPMDFVHGPFNITCNLEDRYQYFRIYLNSGRRDHVAITEIELYVTCDHSYPAGTNVCSECGYKDETVLHEHVYSSEWTYDNDGHWQTCSGTIGICNSPRGNYASHSSGLTCSVCGMPHCHQFDDAGSCRVDGCEYSVSSISQDIFEAQETYGGSSSSSFNNLGNLFDGNTDTKWQATATATAIFKTQVPVRIDGYSFHSVGDDYYLPHPKSWTLYGYDETASAWQIVHSVADASPSNGWNNYRFINNDGPLYSYYKLEITKLQNDHVVSKTNIGGLILDIEPVADHTHISSSEWYSDNFGHWHKCEGEGLCHEQKRDYSSHQFNGGLSCTCGLQHSHQLNVVDGRCNVSGCDYSVDDIPSGFISSVNEYGGSTSTGASVGSLFDGNTDTKWQAGVKATAIFKTQTPVRIDGYSFHSVAGGYYSPHPKSWTLYGFDENTSTWQIVHRVIDASPSNGWNNYRFVNNDGHLYSYFKLEITKLQHDHWECQTNIGGLTLDVIHVHHYVVTYVSKDEHVLTCSEVGKCTVPEIRGGHTLEVVDGTYVCSLCGWRHEHNYTAKQDYTKHWTECDGEGECNARTKDEAVHSYDNTATAGTVPYYTCSVCGHIDPVRQHVHSYSEDWTSDGTHHWHECTSEVGTCQEREKNAAIHVYHDLTFGTTEYYTCDICQYVDETRKAQFEARDYMSMTAVGGDVKIGVDLNPGAEPDYVIQYSKDRVNWTDHAVKNYGVFVTIHSGETYYFRSGMPELLTGVMDENSFWNFTMEGNGTIEAGGNTMSLLDRSCQSLTVGKDGLNGLFFECTLLTVAPELPATELDEYCYCSMFYGCNKLRKAPHLPAKTIKYASYLQMFYECSSLEYVEADFTEASPGGEQTEREQPFYNATYNWLYKTAPNGIVVLKREMIEKSLLNRDKIDIPSRWQRALMVKANEDPDHRGNFYTTFYDNKYSFDVVGDAKAYSGSIEGDELRLTATNGNVIPKGDGVLLHGPSAEMVLVINGGSNQISGNVLTGSDTETTAPANCYILSYGQNKLGFYQYAQGKTLSAHKAYLVYEKPSGAKALRMVFVDDEVDGIESINSDSANSPIGIYSVSGVRLNKLQKGINIVNGKKIIVK